MCLLTVDKQIVPHKYGYKMVEEVSPYLFRSPYLGTIFRLNNTYYANGQETRASDGTHYYAGFHYFLNYSEAKRLLHESSNEHFVLLRVSSRKIIVTGTDASWKRSKTGVSLEITPERIMCRKIKLSRRTREVILKIIHKDKFLSYLINHVNDEKSHKMIYETYLNSYENFKKFVIFTDANIRSSEMFNSCTKLWINIIKHSPVGKQHYDRIISENMIIVDGIPKGEILENTKLREALTQYKFLNDFTL